MTAVETIQAAYAAFGRNDPSVLFGAMAPAIAWNEAEGNPLADRNPDVGAAAVGDVEEDAGAAHHRQRGDQGGAGGAVGQREAIKRVHAEALRAGRCGDSGRGGCGEAGKRDRARPSSGARSHRRSFRSAA